MAEKKSKARDSLKPKKKIKKTAQQEKQKFRGSKAWQNWRKTIKKWYSNRDSLTDMPLRAGWAVHHMDLDENHYQTIDNPNHFRALNRKSHDTVHFCTTTMQKTLRLLTDSGTF